MLELDSGYCEICLAESQSLFRGQTIVFSHCTIFDQFKVEREREKHLKWAKEHSLPSRDEAIRKIISDGSWSVEREKRLENKENDYRILWSKRGKGKIVSLDAIRNYHHDLREMKAEIDIDIVERSLAMPLYQDSYAGGIAFDKEIISRRERVAHTDLTFRANMGDKGQEFVDFVLAQYEKNGFEELNDLTNLLNLKYGNTSVVNEMGGVEEVRSNFSKLQEGLYTN